MPSLASTSNQPEKCPCCNNPWAAATGDFFAQMKMCAACDENETKEEKHEEVGFGVDTSISPADDFYNYANGKWLKENPIPKGYPSWNTFLHLHNLSQERLKGLLEGLGSEGNGNGNDQKVAAYYAAAMDEAKIEADGIAIPMKSLFDKCETAREAASSGNKIVLASALGEILCKFGVSAFFSVGAGPDNKNSDQSICQIAQGGLGLPDKDYYFDEDKEEKRTQYKKHLAKMLTLLDNPKAGEGEGVEALEPTEEAITNAEKIYNLELQLATAHMTKTENRDPEETYNKVSMEDLTSKICKDKFDFGSFFLAATGKSSLELGDVNIRNLVALECAAEAISSVEPEVLHQYLLWRSVRSFAQYMPNAFVMENFDFNERILTGTDEIKPRWKRAMAFTESALGEALGQIYCEKYFDDSCKAKALSIVENVRSALEERLKEVDWMKSDSTRDEALKKMSRFNVKIGYPDKWIDYSTFVIESASDEPFLSMVIKSRQFDHNLEVKEMNAPTDKDKWFMTPQTINAYYHPSLNEIVFPAAILQAPFFDPDADDAINYGAMGAVVGHEMTHGFDDKGRKFNFSGNMVDWWTKDDADEYEKRVEVMVEQANAYEVHGQNVQGKLTCGENIADLGGLRLSLRALMSQKGFDKKSSIHGFTPVQRFFLGWANCWRQNVTQERALQLLTLDPHGPNPMRCNGPLSNMAEFHEAFDVPVGSPMYKEKNIRVDIW